MIGVWTAVNDSPAWSGITRPPRYSAVMPRRGGSVVGSTLAAHARTGGSIPTPPLEFRTGQSADARDLVLSFHYSRRIKSGGRMIGTFHRPDRDHRCIAACVFHEPSARWKERCLELHRLVRMPRCIVPLSRLIALTCRAVKASGIADLLISYADATQGHHGGVYQASGWNYHGQRKPALDGYILPSGEFVPARSARSKLGCNRRHELAARGIIAHWDKGKHLYWRALTPAGEAKAARLGLVRSPYPKPSKLRTTLGRPSTKARAGARAPSHPAQKRRS